MSDRRKIFTTNWPWIEVYQNVVLSKIDVIYRVHGNISFTSNSLRGRRLKGKGKGVLGKGVLGARETRGAREEGGRETPARKPLFFSFLTSTRRMLKSWLVKI